jgi:hypothetical protein
VISLERYLSPWMKTGEIIWSRLALPLNSKRKFSIYRQGDIDYCYTSYAGGLLKSLDEAMVQSDDWFKYYNFTLLTEEQWNKYSILL